jgi:hypothetical protein
MSMEAKTQSNTREMPKKRKLLSYLDLNSRKINSRPATIRKEHRN